jgi:uncharacterized protein YecE (DUF72 family)
MAPTRTPRLRIGCSGWNYKSWSGRFYPADLPSSQWLAFYLRRFDTVETNATFYRLPARDTFASWREQTPPDFVMAIKASRYLTHLKRLLDPEAPLARLFGAASGLGTRLGPVLYQLPPQLGCDVPRLLRFLGALPRELRLDGDAVIPLQHTIEFRDPSWYTADVFGALSEHGVALCLHDMAGSAIDVPRVGPFTYVRFHGAAGKYYGSYGDDTLAAWAARLAGEWRGGRDVYAYFNNDPEAISTRDAARLRERALAAADHPEVNRVTAAAATGRDRRAR